MNLEVLIITMTNIGMFLWLRSEANNDRRHLSACLEGIQKEMKDFHGRLCAIEEKNRRS